MMRTDQTQKVVIKVESDNRQDIMKTTRKGLKDIQPAALDKENLTRSVPFKEIKTNLESTAVKKAQVHFLHKEVQTDEKYIITADDLTSEEAGVPYWRRLAEKRQELLDESLQEIETLKSNVETLQEENKVCKELLEESRHLVEVLQEMINDPDENDESIQEKQNKEDTKEETAPKDSH